MHQEVRLRLGALAPIMEEQSQWEGNDDGITARGARIEHDGRLITAAWWDDGWYVAERRDFPRPYMRPLRALTPDEAAVLADPWRYFRDVASERHRAARNIYRIHLPNPLVGLTYQVECVPITAPVQLVLVELTTEMPEPSNETVSATRWIGGDGYLEQCTESTPCESWADIKRYHRALAEAVDQSAATNTPIWAAAAALQLLKATHS